MSSLKERVEQRMKALNITQAEVTRRAQFKNNTFIYEILNGKKQSVRGNNLNQLAEGLETSVNYLLLTTDDPRPLNYTQQVGRVGRMQQAAPSFQQTADAPEIDKGLYPRDVPLLGISVGGDGDDVDFTLNGQSGDYVRRPPGLVGRQSVYAINIFGESMVPAFRHGALVYVDPKREPGVDEDAVIEMLPAMPGEAGKGFVKRVTKVTGKLIECRQFNPPEPRIFKRAEVKAFHRVIPWEEVLGY